MVLTIHKHANATANRFTRRINWLVVFVLLICIVELLYWRLNIEWFPLSSSVLPAFSPVAAFCLLCLSTSLLLFLHYKTATGLLIAYVLALLPLLAGITRLLDIWQADLLLYPQPLPETGAPQPMPLAVAANIVLAGTILLAHRLRKAVINKLLNYATLLMGLTGLLSIIEYGYLAKELINNTNPVFMPVQAGICFVLLALAMLLRNAEKGFMASVTSPYIGGMVSRLLIPTVIIVPAALGYLRLLLYWHYPSSVETGLSLLVIAIIITFFFFTGYLAKILNRQDALRHQAELRVQQLTIALEKKAEEKQLLLASIVNSSHDAIISKTPQGIITSWNHAAEALFGYSAAEVLNKNITLIIPPHRTEEEKQIIGKIMQGEHVSHFETQRRRKDGMDIDISLTISPIRDAAGNIIGASKTARDISASKKAALQITEAQTLYQSTIDSMMEGCQIIDENWCYRYINTVAARQARTTPEQLIGKTMPAVFPGIEHTNLFRVLTRCMQLRIPEQIENEFVYADGTTGWFELRIQPTMQGLFILSIDITERKKADSSILELNKKLQESESRFRSMIEHSKDAIMLLDEKLKVFYLSPSSERITGWTFEEWQQVRSFELVHPEDLPAMKVLYEKMLTQPDKVFDLCFRQKHRNGYYIWLEGTACNLLQEAHLKGFVFNFRNITARREAEEQLKHSEKIYKTIASGIPGSVICLLDTDHRYLLIEGDMMPRLGYKREQLLGQQASAVLPAPVYTIFQANLKRAFAGEIFTSESATAGVDTLTRYVPLKDEHDTITMVMLAAIDVTALKNAQRKLAELNSSLEQKVVERTQQLDFANKELEAFSYSVSHDLRAPLRIINGFADILVADHSQQLDAEAKRLLGIITSNAQRMGQLIDHLLNFSRMGKLALTPTQVDMQKIVTELIAEQQVLVEKRATIHCNNLLPAMGDASLLRQVWANLISNAIKYSAKNEAPVVEIGCRREEKSLVYFIKDNGVGFDMQYAGKLFGVFQRLHKISEFEGTGVGLALVQRIIRKHNGRVWVEAEPGKGAVFYFSLPAEDPADIQTLHAAPALPGNQPLFMPSSAQQ